MRYALFGAAAASLLLLSSPVYAADVTVGSYKNEKREDFKRLDQIFLGGVRSGLVAYNAYLVSQGQKVAFCFPEHFELSVERAESIMLNWAEKQTIDTNNLPVPVALMEGLKASFPCPLS